MDVGLPEFLLIFGAILLLFGPSKLPELAKSLGAATQQYKKGLNEAKDKLRGEISDVTKPLTEDEKLIKAAESLGIPTQNRSISEIAQDILNYSS